MRIINNVVIGGNSLKYYDISNIDASEIQLKQLYTNVYLSVVNVAGQNLIASAAAPIVYSIDALKIAIDFNTIVSGENGLISVQDSLIYMGLYDKLMACPEITEEQFYDLTAPTE
jgi:hypothetical protein